MTKFLRILMVGLALLLAQTAIQAQINGSVSGTVTDANGAVVPGATVKVVGSGIDLTATTTESGTFRVPAVPNGLYTVTITARGFKTTNVRNVKVDVGTPATVDASLEAGAPEVSVEVTSGGEVLQTETATVSRSVTGRQINETPIASRDALDLVLLMPGTNTVGAPRRSSINGLPKGALSITIDGVDVQDNNLRSSDGYFTYVRPRVDAIDEVSVSTANPGAEASGDGAVTIKFVTKRGTNDYRGGAFWQHRDESLNANYWFNNRDGVLDSKGNALRQKIRLNQYGFHFGGPIPFLGLGEGVPVYNSGKNKRFFFFNWEQYRIPASQARTRVVLTPSAQSGIYTYTGSSANGAAASTVPGGAGTCTKVNLTDTTQTCAVNVFTVAGNNGFVNSFDPTIGAIFNQIRSATSSAGNFTPGTDVNVQNWNYNFPGKDLRKFLALRFDFNITKKHSVEFVINKQDFVPAGPDFLNSVEARFPGMTGYSQGSTRDSYSFAVRSAFSNSIVNEFRVAASRGTSEFRPGISKTDFANQQGYNLGIGIGFTGSTTTGATAASTYSARKTPTTDYTDSLTWIMGKHSLNIGGQFKRIDGTSWSQTVVPSIGFGIDSTEGTAFTMFGATNLPGSSATQQGIARSMYAVFSGHVLSWSNTALLTDDGTYKTNVLQGKSNRQDVFGLYAQDSWKISPNFTLNFGLRWQPQKSPIVMSANWARLENFNQIFGPSGPNGSFNPGATGGTNGRVVAMTVGEKAYSDDWKNYAPTVGFVWSPGFKGGIGKLLFGEQGKSVFRGGYSVAFVREGTAIIESILGANPGGSLPATRSLANGTLLSQGTLLRTPGNPNLTDAPFSATPSYPISVSTATGANTYDPSLKTGSVDSYTFGYQRELDKNSVIEIRYVGNRGRNLQRQFDYNEFNTIENGFASEFVKAQQNLYLNKAAGKGNTFAYFTDVAGSNQLPIMLSYFTNFGSAGALATAAGVPANYTATNFANTTLVASLNVNAPTINTWTGTTFENNPTRRANAIANGRPANFFYVNSNTLSGGAFSVDNSAHSWYDSAQFEFRRRLSSGLRVQASYVFAKALSDLVASSSVVFGGYSKRPGGLDIVKNVAVFDIRQALKFDATYDLPFGRGRQFFSGTNRVLDGVFGGWSILPTFRLQSGSPIQVGNVQLVGMTVKEFQKMVKINKNVLDSGTKGNPNAASAATPQVAWLPIDVIQNSRAAFNLDITTATGYSSQFGVPTGKFIAPAGYGNCVNKSTLMATCGYQNLIIYGPSYFKFDVTFLKKFKITETANVELRATALDAFNKPNWRVGGWGGDAVGGGCCSGTGFGFLGNGTAYQDISTTNDNGGRQIDLLIRVNW